MRIRYHNSIEYLMRSRCVQRFRGLYLRSQSRLMSTLDLGKPGDFHVHLRDGVMARLVTPFVHSGGVSVCYVMPNLVPPLDNVPAVLEYHARLQAIDPRPKYLMSLYLSPNVTPETIREAKSRGIYGVKCYPAGVTTNSAHGVGSYEPFFPVFAEMERSDLVLNLHGECPSGDDVNVLNAEPKFLPTLRLLHTHFPKLRIVLEHCTTRAAVEAVQQCGDSVVATITCHHLFLTVDSWGGNAFNFCKPVAKLPDDRQALLDAATSGSPKFFFGSDSAPHPIEAKTRGSGASAGVFTQNAAIAYIAEAFDRAGRLENLRKFVTENGKKFYRIDDAELGDQSVQLVHKPSTVPEYVELDGVRVVPFLAGETLKYQVEWH